VSAAPEIVWGDRGGRAADGFVVEIGCRCPHGWTVWVHTPDGRFFNEGARTLKRARRCAETMIGRLRRS
jgi:hypothetical protein